jgi:hypothetical protein
MRMKVKDVLNLKYEEYRSERKTTIMGIKWRGFPPLGYRHLRIPPDLQVALEGPHSL